ncbi:hypothetical protein BKA69DRAFT_669428 [Paraphysoderma sedebokerense]|nr:hypothetical protein BKA69DRAFT_669428 [Paraphysoderma sedebokerense]
MFNSTVSKVTIVAILILALNSSVTMSLPQQVTADTATFQPPTSDSTSQVFSATQDIPVQKTEQVIQELAELQLYHRENGEKRKNADSMKVKDPSGESEPTQAISSRESKEPIKVQCRNVGGLVTDLTMTPKQLPKGKRFTIELYTFSDENCAAESTGVIKMKLKKEPFDMDRLNQSCYKDLKTDKECPPVRSLGLRILGAGNFEGWGDLCSMGWIGC